MYRFLGRHPVELLAVLASTIAIVGGALLAWFRDPMCLNRAGALVIIIGVLLAASRFQDWVQQKVRLFLDANYESLADNALKSVEMETRPLSDADRRRVKEKMKGMVQKDLADHFEGVRKRMRAWEVCLVVIGTFLNGFGDLLVTLLKNHGT